MISYITDVGQENRFGDRSNTGEDMQTVSGRNRMVGMPSMRYYTLNAENIG